MVIDSFGMIVLCMFASYGLAYTITRKDGPYDGLARLRTKLGAYDYGENGQPKRGVGRFIKCPYCVGVWIAFIMLVSVSLFPESIWFVYWWAIAGGQFFLQKGVRGG